MCGIIAVIHGDPASTSAAVEIHDALYLLQHRGQDACGIVSSGSKGRIYQCKGNGMASKVFHDGSRVADLPGFMGLGHLRYPTAGSSGNAEAQPFYVNSPYGICFTHNGNLINATTLRNFLDKEAHRHINTDSDSEIMLDIFANELNETGKARVNANDCFAALRRMYGRCVGAWACTAMIAGYGLIGFRDSYGIRPMVLGSKMSESGAGMDYMMASESVALSQCGYSDFVDIKPGEAVIIEKGMKPIFHQVEERKAYAPDIFEYVYFARPDSIIDGIDVDESRRNMGFNLAKVVSSQLGEETVRDIDAIMPIPETSITSALCVAEALKKPYCQGFVKNRYIFRTFIMPNQKQRQKGVRAKLNPMRAKFEGRNVLLVDDSIVRGTTSREIVLMAREAGAKKVYFASCAPPITNVHIYGIDLASNSELIAHCRSSTDIAKIMGADAVIYQDLPSLKTACATATVRQTPDTPKDFEVGVFSGSYITPVENNYFGHLEKVRRESRRMKDMDEMKDSFVNNPFFSVPLNVPSFNGESRTDGQTVAELDVAKLKLNPVDVQNLKDVIQATQNMAERPSEARDQQDISLHNMNDQ